MLFPDFVVYFARSRRTDSGKLIDGALGGAADIFQLVSNSGAEILM